MMRKFKDALDDLPTHLIEGWDDMTTSWGASVDQARAQASADGLPCEAQGAIVMAVMFCSFLDDVEGRKLALLITKYVLDALGGDRAS